MKRTSFFSVLLALAVAFVACDSETTEDSPQAVSYTYAMRLEGGLTTFAGDTRSASGWDDGASIYLQFLAGTARTSGKAVYDADEDVWTVTTTKALAADDEGTCEAYYVAGGSVTSQRITLTSGTALYGDAGGSYSVDEETNAVIVHAQLSPLTGRIRFTGKPGDTFAVSGLTRYTTYTFSTGALASAAAKLTGTIGADGSSDYYYVVFTDTEARTLTAEGSDIIIFTRSFSAQVLAPGSSGFVTLPTQEAPGKWTMTNKNNGKEITLPAVSAVEVTNVRARSVSVGATVTDLGNGTIADAGFLYATSPTVTEETATKKPLGSVTSLSIRLSGLESLTTYYVRAYARNQRGITLGNIASFTTTDGSESSTIDREGYDDDDLDGGDPFDGIISRDGYGNDENLNSGDPFDGIISRDGYGNDENWN